MCNVNETLLKYVECKCNYASDSEPESHSEEESCVSACSDSGDDSGPGPRKEPERPNGKGYLKCEMCDHCVIDKQRYPYG